MVFINIYCVLLIFSQVVSRISLRTFSLFFEVLDLFVVLVFFSENTQHLFFLDDIFNPLLTVKDDFSKVYWLYLKQLVYCVTISFVAKEGRETADVDLREIFYFYLWILSICFISVFFDFAFLLLEDYLACVSFFVPEAYFDLINLTHVVFWLNFLYFFKLL